MDLLSAFVEKVGTSAKEGGWVGSETDSVRLSAYIFEVIKKNINTKNKNIISIC